MDGYSLMYLFREDRASFETYLKDMKRIVTDLGSVTFVIDRRAAKEKKDTLAIRRELREGAQDDVKEWKKMLAESPEMDDKQKEIIESVIAQRERASWHVYPEYMTWLLGVLEAIGIRVIKAEQEADLMLARGPYDVVVSSDSDMLILGARRLWLPRGVGIQHNEIIQKDFIRFIGLEADQLYELAFLAGCDYHKSSMSVAEAVSRLKFYGSLEGIHRRHPELVSAEDVGQYKKLKETVWTV